MRLSQMKTSTSICVIVASSVTVGCGYVPSVSAREWDIADIAAIEPCRDIVMVREAYRRADCPNRLHQPRRVSDVVINDFVGSSELYLYRCVCRQSEASAAERVGETDVP